MSKSKELTVSCEMLHSAAKKIADIADEVDKERMEFSAALTALRENWNTPAGRLFFERKGVDWEPIVATYHETMTVIASLLRQATQQYQEVFEEARRLSIS